MKIVIVSPIYRLLLSRFIKNIQSLRGVFLRFSGKYAFPNYKRKWEIKILQFEVTNLTFNLPVKHKISFKVLLLYKRKSVWNKSYQLMIEQSFEFCENLWVAYVILWGSLLIKAYLQLIGTLTEATMILDACICCFFIYSRDLWVNIVKTIWLTKTWLYIASIIIYF